MTTTARLLSWTDIPLEPLNPLLARQCIHGEHATLSHIHLKKGALVPRHAHHNEQFSAVITGAMLFRLGPEGATDDVIIRPGQVLHIPPHIPHSAEALEDTLNIDFFAPRRQDWMDKDDAYLR